MINIPSINETLIKYEYAELTHDKLADEIGFNSDEKKMLNIFWEPTFNSGWIYLSDEIVLSQLTNENGKDTINRFNSRMLLSGDYEENIDFKLINKNDNLVKLYESYCSPNLESKEKSNKGGHNKKYYAISGDTYKDLLQKSANKKGKQTRKYYRKIEQLAIFMKDYINALHKHILETKLSEKDDLIKEKNTRIQEEKDKFNRIHLVNEEYLSYKKLKDKNETIYIVSTFNYARQGIFKIGRTKNIKTRSSTHNTTHVSGDKIKILKEFKVNDSQLVEKIIHKKLNGLLVKGDVEFFMCPYDLLENITDVIVNGDDNYNELVNSIIDTVNSLRVLSYDESRWMTGIEMNIFNEEMRLIIPSDSDNSDEIKAVFNVTNATHNQKQEFVRQCYIAYKQTITEPRLLLWSKFTPYLFEQLTMSKRKYKSSEWKPLFNAIKSTQDLSDKGGD